MEIIGDDYKLHPVNDYTPRFNVELLYTVKPKKGPERQEFKLVAYGCTIDYAVQLIIHHRIHNAFEKDLSLKQYFNEFKKELNTFKNLFTYEKEGRKSVD